MELSHIHLASIHFKIPIFLFVSVAPMIWVQNQLEYAIVGRNVSLHCNTESYPPAIHYWRLGNQTAISSGNT